MMGFDSDEISFVYKIQTQKILGIKKHPHGFVS